MSSCRVKGVLGFINTKEKNRHGIQVIVEKDSEDHKAVLKGLEDGFKSKKKAEDRMKEVDTERYEFLAGLEFKNPVAINFGWDVEKPPQFHIKTETGRNQVDIEDLKKARPGDQVKVSFQAGVGKESNVAYAILQSFCVLKNLPNLMTEVQDEATESFFDED